MTRPKVALVHNRYQQPGGEDVVFSSEAALLAARSHDVVSFSLDNAAIEQMGRLQLATSSFWNRAVHRELGRLFREARPEVAHFHNTFPLISPAAYYAARDHGVAVVQTVHNYRLICPAGTLYRQGAICEECVGRATPWPSVVHGCYRASRAATAVGAGMLAFHRSLGTWNNLVDAYIALTSFARRKLIEGGIPESKIVVKPNFLGADPGVGEHAGRFALFVGRLTPEKGLETLLEAWERLDGAYPLKIVGGGPLEALVAKPRQGVEWLGRQPVGRVHALMRDASFLVFPSEWYEGFPMTLVEAFATGLPVIASALGSIAEIVADNKTGRLFAPGDSCDLAAAVEWSLSHPRELVQMSRHARQEFENNYTAERNYELLLDIYRRAMARAA